MRLLHYKLATTTRIQPNNNYRHMHRDDIFEFFFSCCEIALLLLLGLSRVICSIDDNYYYYSLLYYAESTNLTMQLQFVFSIGT